MRNRNVTRTEARVEGDMIAIGNLCRLTGNERDTADPRSDELSVVEWCT